MGVGTDFHLGAFLAVAVGAAADGAVLLLFFHDNMILLL